jgi:hypothetical protein
MTGWRVRDYSQDDLEALIRVDMESGTTEEPPLFPLSDAVTALQTRHPAVVATADDVLIGAAVSRVEGERAWILRICMAPGWRQRGLGSALITALEQRLFWTRSATPSPRSAPPWPRNSPSRRRSPPASSVQADGESVCGGCVRPAQVACRCPFR